MASQSIFIPWFISFLLFLACGYLYWAHRHDRQQQRQLLLSLKEEESLQTLVSEQSIELQQARQQEALYKRLAENAMDCIWLLDLQTYTFEYVSPSVYQLRGLTAEEAVGETLEDAFTPDSVSKIYKMLNHTMEQLMSTEEYVSNGIVCQLEQYKRDGTMVFIEVSIRMIFEQQGTLKILGVSRDISEKRKLEERLSKEQEEAKIQSFIYEALFKNTRDAVAYFDDEERIVAINDRFSSLFGYTREEANGRYINDLVFSQHRKGDTDILPIALETIQASTVELQTIRYHRDGTPIHVLAKGVPIYINGTFWGGYGVYTDITPLKQTEKQLQYLATTDALTGLFNRRHFMESASVELEKTKRYHHPLSLILLDIDHFKRVNDTYGHDVGDMVLVLLSNQLKQHARNTDEVFRLGGEEFGMLLPSTGIDGAYVAAERLRVAIEGKKFINGHHEIYFTISLGIAQVTDDVEDVDTLFKAADHALYEAKSRGRNQVVLSEQSHH